MNKKTLKNQIKETEKKYFCLLVFGFVSFFVSLSFVSLLVSSPL